MLTEFSLTDWFTVVGICALGAVSPGPSLAIIIKHSLAGGRLSGAVAALTHGVTVGAYALASISGLALLIKSSGLVFVTLQWSGICYLLWLGCKGLFYREDKTNGLKRSAGGTPPSKSITPIPVSGREDQRDDAISLQKSVNAARDGFMIVFLNPKIALFFIALFSQFIHPESSLITRMIYGFTALVIDAGWYLLVVWLISLPVWLSKLQQQALWIERVSGVILLVLAGFLIFDLLTM